MKHEFLNGDAMKEIIKDESVELFMMWPPYMGMSTGRYGHTAGQLNGAADTILFAKRLAKIAKNCEKALKDTGNLLYILPVTDLSLRGYVHKYISKKTNLQFNGNLIWYYRMEEGNAPDKINQDYCDILWYSKGKPRVDYKYLVDNLEEVIRIPLKPMELVEDYGKLGEVHDSLPIELAEHLIKLFTAEGDTVANILSGTGTTSIAAENTGRDSIYNDISYVQLTIAKKRMEDLIAKKKKALKQ